MIGHLQESGHTLTTDRSEADVIIVNTCSFIEGSKRESIDTVLEAAELKKSGQCKRLIVTGCLAERYPELINTELPEVDAILGTNQLVQISEAVAEKTVAPPASFGRSDADLFLYDHDTPRTLITPRYSAYMKISEGCDHSCAFCIIPKLRGPLRSRTVASLRREAERLVEGGVGEITLVSQDSTSFGADQGLVDGLSHLLEELAQVEGLTWLRFLYAYPNMVSDRLLRVVAENEKICNYIDLPLQHASAGILKSMQRGSGRIGLSRLIRKIRRTIRDVTIRSTLMVGFPGETEEDFQQLKEFVQEMEFDRLGVFAYSDEEDTAAYELEGKVPSSTARRRRRELMKIQEKIVIQKHRRLLGRELPILIEGPAEESELLLQGRLQSQAPEIDGICYINDSEVGPVEAGDFRTVRITGELTHDLLATVVA
jgi:ribosomal protein S12 methylthiotransferase